MKKNIPLLCALAIALVVFSTNGYGRAASVLSASITASHSVTCNGGNTGSATVTASGGSAPYTYFWAPGGETNSTASNLSAGTYTVTVTDATSSTATASVTIAQPLPLVASVTLNSNGGALTSIVDVSGTAAYSGDGGPATAAEVYAPTSVTTDKYRNVYISDWDNHRVREVSATTGIITTIAGNGVKGFSGNGGPATACEFGGTTDASVDSSGNLWIADYLNNAVYVVTNSTTNPWPNNLNGGNPTTPGYIYLFDTAIYPLVQNIFFDATGNMYFLVQGGIGYFDIVTNSTTNPWPQIINGGNPTVPGTTYTMTSNGRRYQGLTFDRAGNLYYTSLDYPFIYIITKTSTNPWPALLNNGNPTIPGRTYVLYSLPTPPHHSGPGPTWLAFDKYQNLYVADYYSNQIYVVPWQGNSTSGYPFIDSTGIAGYTTNGNSLSGYIDWPASCMIDNENNMYISDQQVTPHSGIQKVSLDYLENVSCYGYSNGSVTVTGVGGTTPYNYKWASGQTTSSINGLPAGVYTVTITDNNGCTAYDTITITPASAMTITQNSVAQHGPCNGLAEVTVSGATPPYNYLWSPGGQTNDTIDNQCAGSYCCTITDNNGCAQTTCVTVGVNVTIYPDPNKGNFIISGITQGQTVALYDYTGRKIKEAVADLSEIQMDISSMANGIYLISIKNTDGTIVLQKKIVKI